MDFSQTVHLNYGKQSFLFTFVRKCSNCVWSLLSLTCSKNLISHCGDETGFFYVHSLGAVQAGRLPASLAHSTVKTFISHCGLHKVFSCYVRSKVDKLRFVHFARSLASKSSYFGASKYIMVSTWRVQKRQAI